MSEYRLLLLFSAVWLAPLNPGWVNVIMGFIFLVWAFFVKSGGS
jgi:hypothetical protein